MRQIQGGITVPQGFKAAGVHCGIKKNRPDLALIYSEGPAVSYGMFTSNKIKAAPVMVSIRRIRKMHTRSIVANSGNANACTGERGIKDAERMSELVAHLLGINKQEVLVASTGIIGKPLPMSKIEEGIRQAVKALSYQGAHQAAEAILTTDKMVKEIAVETDIPGRGKGKVRIAGMIKGSGMISPNLATMLCFITTDACIAEDALKEATKSAVNKSFNQISVDGDMSTNDSIFILANGLARNKRIKTWHKKRKMKVEDENFHHFQQALDYVCLSLAKMVIRDGEGATKLIEVEVDGAPFPKDARRVARRVANSLLVKTAVGGGSPNWGRVMAALGAAEAKIKPSKVEVYIGGLPVVKGGKGMDTEEEKIREVLRKDEVKISIRLNQGSNKATFWGCDLTEKYVGINKRYI